MNVSRSKYRCFQIICRCCLLIYILKRTTTVTHKKGWRSYWRPFCWSWLQQPHFYFRQESLIEYDREKMRVWGRWRLQILPNNQEDASDQPVSPSCACYLINFILLFNFTGMKVCCRGSHQPCSYMRNYVKQQCRSKFSSSTYLILKRNSFRQSICLCLAKNPYCPLFTVCFSKIFTINKCTNYMHL